MFVLACVYLPVVSFPSVGDGVIEEERDEVQKASTTSRSQKTRTAIKKPPTRT